MLNFTKILILSILVSLSTTVQANATMAPIVSYLLSNTTPTYTQTTMLQGTTYAVTKGDKIKRDTNPTTIIVETNLHTKTTTAKLESGSATLIKIK